MSGISYTLRDINAVVFDVDGVLSPSTVPMDDQGHPVRMINVKDAYAIQLAVKNGIMICIITGGESDTIRKGFASLGVSDIFTGVARKEIVLEKWMHDCNVNKQEVAYMGDDIPDLKCLRTVGLPCCPHDAVAEVRMTSTYISRFAGGYGCARDLLEQVLKAKNLWLNDNFAYEW